MKTYPRHRTHPAIMGCGGKGKPECVIDRGRVMRYVGIGWVDEGPATAADRRKYPTLVDGKRQAKSKTGIDNRNRKRDH